MHVKLLSSSASPPPQAYPGRGTLAGEGKTGRVGMPPLRFPSRPAGSCTRCVKVPHAAPEPQLDHPCRRVLKLPSLWWLARCLSVSDRAAPPLPVCRAVVSDVSAFVHHPPSMSIAVHRLKPIRLPHRRNTSERHNKRKSETGTEVVGQMLSFSYFRIPLWGLLIAVCFLEGEASSCPKGWLSYVSNCYGLFPDKMARKEAEAECQSLGHSSHLASILSDTEQAVVIKYVTTSFPGVGNVWIGLRDHWGFRRWSWEDGSKTNDLYWAADAPKLLTRKQHCVYMKDAEAYKTWKDADCSEQYAFLCKMKS